MLVECTRCEALVDGVPQGSYIFSPPDDVRSRVWLLRCPRCYGPFVAMHDEIGPDEWSESRQLFPAIDSPLSAAVPKPIARAFDEARSCIRVKAYTAAAIMCRKVLERVCVAHDVKETNLKKSLAALRDEHVVDERLFEWADELRLFGNEAAHGVGATISKQDSEDTIAFTNALLEYVFTFRDRFEEFKKRRGKGTA